MNRFYKDVSTGPVGPFVVGGQAAGGGGFAVLLDGRPVRTPQKSLMAAPNEKLAKLVAGEWAAQEEIIAAATMPLTQFLTTAIDRIHMRAELTEEVIKYLNGDLLCYRAGDPETLAAEQERLWNPWLQWFSDTYGHRLETTFALSRLDQSQAAHKAALDAINAMDDHAFTVLQAAVPLTGSLVLGLAIAADAITPEDALACALCEELFYERIHDLERHGLDPAEEKRRAALACDLAAARDYLKATRS